MRKLKDRSPTSEVERRELANPKNNLRESGRSAGNPSSSRTGILKFHELLCNPIQVQLTEDQQDRFYHFFRKIQVRYHALLDDAFIATVRRMGLNFYRFMMILSALRYQNTGDIPYKITCREEDFCTALGMIRSLFRHSIQG